MTNPEPCTKPDSAVERALAELSNTAYADHFAQILSLGLTQDGSAVAMTLRADAEQYAKSVKQKYGDLVQLQVGRFAYPRGAKLDYPLPPCDKLPEGVSAPPGLEIAANVPATSIQAGADGAGSIEFINVSSMPQSIAGEQPILGVVVRQASSEVVAEFIGNIAGTGMGVTILPGEKYSVPLFFGTASCNESNGYAIHPGPYDLVALVQLQVGGQNEVFRTVPVAISVAD